MRYGALIAAIAVVFVSLSGSIWWLAARCDRRVTPEEFETEIELRAQRIRSAHVALMNCSNALARATAEIEGCSTFTPGAEQLGQSTKDLTRRLEKAIKRIKELELHSIDVCRDEKWPEKPKPHLSIPGPKRLVKVIAWHPPAIFMNNHKASRMVPVPRGMERYFANTGVDISTGMIPADMVQHGSYKPICDGLAVRHTNFSEFYESDIIFMDNPLSGATTEMFADELLPPRLPHHFWVLRFAGEGLSYYPGLGSPSLLRQFNFTIGYHRGLYNMYAGEITGSADGSDRHAVPYIDLNMTRIMRNPLNDPFTVRNASASIVMFISNCMARNKRSEYVEQLMQLLPVHSYGRCMNNMRIPSELLAKYGAAGGAIGDWHGVKMDILRKYKFLIAFENSDCYDYVTEKVFDGLNAGAIPIYMGAPNIREFVPDHSVIHASDFSDPASLARYIELVERTPALFASYWEWRKRPLPERIEKLKAKKKRNICDFVQQLQWT